MKAVVLLSGGLDSTTLAYYVKKRLQAEEIIAVSFDYGQRHRRELAAATDLAEVAKVEHHVIQLREVSELWTSPLAGLLSGSALTDESVPVPDGHYAEDNMKATVVPNRNAIMLSIAYGVAVARHFDYVFFAAHSGDHRIYPDCRPEFVAMLNETLQMGNLWAEPVPQLEGPFLHLTKGSIAGMADELGVPIAMTWSCYKGNDIHCGTCGTCYERREAFEEAGIKDPTEYLDSTTRFTAPT